MRHYRLARLRTVAPYPAVNGLVVGHLYRVQYVTAYDYNVIKGPQRRDSRTAWSIPLSKEEFELWFEVK